MFAVESKGTRAIPAAQLRFFLAILSRKMFRSVHSATDSHFLAGFGDSGRLGLRGFLQDVAPRRFR